MWQHMHTHTTSGDLFLKNKKQQNLSRATNALAFIEAAGGPAVIYISSGVLVRLLVGKRRARHKNLKSFLYAKAFMKTSVFRRESIRVEF